METVQISRMATASPQHAGAPMGSVASELKLAREKRKISLAQIAADTHISLRHLESLEEGRYADLPGGMYNRAFLRAYCESLNLDQKEIIRRYEAEILPFSEKSPKAKVHIPPQSPSLRPSPVIIWSLALLISATGLFFSRKWIAAVFSPYFAHAPAASVHYGHPAQTDVSSVAVPSAPRASQPIQPPAPPAATPESAPVSSGEPLTSPQTPVQTDVAASGAISGAVPSTSPQTLRLEVSVTDKCWISIDRDGNPAFRKLLEPGEARSIGATEKFFIIVGNAGAVHLKINGKPLKPIGRAGQVVRLLIDEKNLPDLLDQTAG